MDYKALPSAEVIKKTMAALTANHISVQLVENTKHALVALRQLLPPGADIMTGGSVTLEKIGFVDLLKSKKHPWRNLKDVLLAEKDASRQLILRKKSTLADYFIGSVHAITETGQTITVSASGSQIPSYAYSSNTVIWVVGAQKIVPTLEDGLARIRHYVLPLENQHMKNKGLPGSNISMMLVYESAAWQRSRNIHLILINEAVGF